MRIVNLAFIWIFLFITANAQRSETLYPVREGNLWDYINSSGKIIIKPQFHVAGKFSEGLAAVRLNGTYGYIDSIGHFVIQPKYDLALSFIKGQAEIYINGKPFMIDKSGHITFQHNFQLIYPLGNHDFTIVETETKKFGVINRKGILLLDTAFKNIRPFVNGVAVVEGLNHLPYPDNNEKPVYEVGIVDSTGHWLVKYGRYEEIEPYVNGYTVATQTFKDSATNKWQYKNALVDKTGKERFVMSREKTYFSYEEFNDGLCPAKIYFVEWDTVKVRDRRRDSYFGVINADGQILFSDSSWQDLTPFSFNRAFIEVTKNKWQLINNNGQKISDSLYSGIIGGPNREKENLFENGTAFVELRGDVCIIDTNGKVLTKPQPFEDVNCSEVFRRNNELIFQEDVSTEHKDYDYLYGFWNPANNAIVKPKFVDIDVNSFNSGLIRVITPDERIGCINAVGKVIWEEKKKEKEVQPLNIDYMNSGYFLAASPYKKDLAGYGGWGESDNLSKKDSFGKGIKAPQVVIDTSKNITWMDEYKGLKLSVINGAKDTLYFDAQDSRLYLKLQAQDKYGEWKDIEYLPSSWCGNSYHTLYLAPTEYWDFTMPVYNGEFKTKIRAQLLYKQNKKGEDETVYSNIINGYVNPGQFWNKRQYYPSDIMDPYND